MGSASQNFYNNAFARQAFAEEIKEVQQLWRQAAAESAIENLPFAFVRHTR